MSKYDDLFRAVETGDLDGVKSELAKLSQHETVRAGRFLTFAVVHNYPKIVRELVNDSRLLVKKDEYAHILSSLVHAGTEKQVVLAEILLQPDLTYKVDGDVLMDLAVYAAAHNMASTVLLFVDANVSPAALIRAAIDADAKETVAALVMKPGIASALRDDPMRDYLYDLITRYNAVNAGYLDPAHRLDEATRLLLFEAVREEPPSPDYVAALVRNPRIKREDLLLAAQAAIRNRTARPADIELVLDGLGDEGVDHMTLLVAAKHATSEVMRLVVTYWRHGDIPADVFEAALAARNIHAATVVRPLVPKNPGM